MRRILVENARRKHRIKHGGNQIRQDIEPELIEDPAQDHDILALDAALTKFTPQHPIQSRLVELRFFAGLTGDEAADTLGISPSTVEATLEARLKLFIDVCHAIQHAHQKGIIHRDIKPSNVMVTLHDGLPVVKVIDFGVAKATSQHLTARTVFTELGQIVGTPECGHRCHNHKH